MRTSLGSDVRMLLGGFKADFDSVWVELICVRCAAQFLH